MNRAKLLPYSVKRPIILNRKHFLINLIVLYAYDRIKYNDERQTLAELREEFWMPRGKSFMKQVSRSSMICRKFNASPYSYPKIPDLLPERLDDQPSFSGVGIDYTGFLFCKNVFFNDSVDEDNLFKCYIVIYTCAATRGIVLDLVPDALS